MQELTGKAAAVIALGAMIRSRPQVSSGTVSAADAPSASWPCSASQSDASAAAAAAAALLILRLQAFFFGRPLRLPPALEPGAASEAGGRPADPAGVPRRVPCCSQPGLGDVDCACACVCGCGWGGSCESVNRKEAIDTSRQGGLSPIRAEGRQHLARHQRCAPDPRGCRRISAECARHGGKTDE